MDLLVGDDPDFVHQGGIDFDASLIVHLGVRHRGPVKFGF